jgi:hypothetical protein
MKKIAYLILLISICFTCSEKSSIDDINDPDLKTLVIEKGIDLNSYQIEKLNEITRLADKYGLNGDDNFKIHWEKIINSPVFDIEQTEETFAGIARAKKYNEAHNAVMNKWSPKVEAASTLEEKREIINLIKAKDDSIRREIYSE